MYKSILRLTALAIVLSVSMWADSITIDGTSSAAMFGTWFGGRGWFPTIPGPTPPPDPSPTPSPVTEAPIIAAATPSTGSASGASVNVFSSYNSTLYGAGLTYTNGMFGSTVTGNPVTLGSTSALTYNSYLNSLPTGGTLTGATLNLSLLIGDPTAGVLGSSTATASLAGALGALSVTINSGSVTKTLSGTDLNAYDLFANGFGAQILSGAALSLTFSAADEVTPTVSLTSGTPSTGGRGFFFSPTTTANLTDTRTITGSNLANYLTLVYTSSSNNSASTSPNIVPYFGPAPDGLADDPEPAPTALVGGGMALIAYLRWKKNRRRTA